MAPQAEPAPLGEVLGHYDPAQLFFQLAEIVEERTYLRYGIEVGPGDVVVDVGANVGVAAAFFASHCGAGTVHCFEPIPAIREQLERNMAQFEACTTHPFGLGARDETVEMTFYPRAAAMSGSYADPEHDREAVRAYMRNVGVGEAEADANLDGLHDGERVDAELRRLSTVIPELGLDRIDLLKVDVEGAEEDVLAGIDDVHWPLIRQVAGEVHEVEGRPERIEALLSGRGFDVVFEQEEQWRGTGVRMLYARRAS